MAGALEKKNGAGWILTLVETMRAEWHVSLEQAVFKESLTAALTLWPAYLARHGAPVECDFGDQARQAGKEKMRKWIGEHFDIFVGKTPDPNFMSCFELVTPDGHRAPQ